NTAVPSDLRISAPAPEAMHNGTTPRMKANDVIRMGRSRNRDASTVASKTDRPRCKCSSLANSTTRMAFLHASPTSTTRPIRTKKLTKLFVHNTPISDQSTHNGTTRITANGSVQLSYSAANARKTHTTASPNTMPVVLPSLICMNISSVHSTFIERGS